MCYATQLSKFTLIQQIPTNIVNTDSYSCNKCLKGFHTDSVNTFVAFCKLYPHTYIENQGFKIFLTSILCKFIQSFCLLLPTTQSYDFAYTFEKENEEVLSPMHRKHSVAVSCVKNGLHRMEVDVSI